MQVTLYELTECDECKATKDRFRDLGIKHTTVESTFGDRCPVVVVDCGDHASWTWFGYQESQIERLAELL